MLFTFPSRYLFTIGQYEYLALDLSRPDFIPDFSCLVLLKKKLGNCMVFRDTGLSPSLVRRSRRVLLNSKHNSLWAYRLTITSTYNAILATTVIFKFSSCDSNNTKMVWANRYLFAGYYKINPTNKFLYTSAFARHYWRNLVCLTTIDLFSTCYWDVSLRTVPALHTPRHIGMHSSSAWVSPFGHPRIKAYCQLPEAFRRLSRPSSAHIA